MTPEQRQAAEDERVFAGWDAWLAANRPSLDRTLVLIDETSVKLIRLQAGADAQANG